MHGRPADEIEYPLADLRHIPEVDPVLHGAMQLPYLRRRRALWLRKPRSPRFLYKFCSLRRPHARGDGEPPFEQESVERLRVNIVRSLLRLSSADDLNDPFEMGAHWVIQGTVQERLARFRAMVRDRGPHANFKERDAAVRRLMGATEDELLALVRGSYARQRREFGICCFAGRGPDNVLMWSHYANEHRGICLQFELARDLPVFMRAMTVDYIDEYPTINWIDPDFGQAVGKTFTRKHTRWTYEGERRIIVDGHAGTYLRFNPDALTAIIFGCRADNDVKDTIGALLEERAARDLPEVRRYYARQNPKRYELDILSG